MESQKYPQHPRTSAVYAAVHAEWTQYNCATEPNSTRFNLQTQDEVSKWETASRRWEHWLWWQVSAMLSSSPGTCSSTVVSGNSHHHFSILHSGFYSDSGREGNTPLGWDPGEYKFFTICYTIQLNLSLRIPLYRDQPVFKTNNNLHMFCFICLTCL